jgi:hypothetical protein
MSDSSCIGWQFGKPCDLSFRGQTPAEADIHFLENAKKLAMYGVDLHKCVVSIIDGEIGSNRPGVC